MSSPRTPPRRADRLLAAALPEGLLGSTIIGDLHQEYEERAARQGALRVGLWYWGQSAALAARYSWQSLRGRSPGYHRMLDSAERPARREAAQELIATLPADLRYGFRMLLRWPTLSIVSILTIGLGIGLTVFTFSQVYGSVMRGIPVPDDDRLMSLRASNEERGIRETSFSYADYLVLRAEGRSFEDLAAFYQGTVNLASEGAAPERYAGAFVTDNALAHAGISAHLGRTFRPGDSTPDAAPMIVLSHHVWENRFGGDRDIVGKTVRANGETAQVIGVMPEGYRFPVWDDVWLNLRYDPDRTPRRSQLVLIFGRIREGVGIPAATQEADAVVQRHEATDPDAVVGSRALIQQFEREYMPPRIVAVMWLMLGSVLGVLLIACANVANLLLARASTRSREVAVRAALGASRLRVVRQLLVESLLLAIIGGVLGLVFASAGIELYNGFTADIQKPYWIDVRLDRVGLAFAATAIMLVTLAAGTIPALRASGSGTAGILQDDSRAGSSLRLGRFSRALVMGELAVSCALLVVAGLMIRSVVNVTRVELGFATDGVVTGRMGLFETDYPERSDRNQFFTRLIEEVRDEPGVEAAALTVSLPGTQSDMWPIEVEGAAYAGAADYPRVNAIVVGTGFFDTFGVPILQGRDFRAEDRDQAGELRVIVNRTFVERFLGNGSPLGRRIRAGRGGSTNPWARVIGVVPDLHVGGGVGGLGSDRLPTEAVYYSRGRFDVRFMTVAMRSSLPPDEAKTRLRAAVARIDAELPVYDLHTMAEALARFTWAFGLLGSLFSILGGAALFLAAVGLYGVVSFSVSSRRQELGIRMALGADGRRILGLVLRKGLAELAIGLAVGLGLGALMSRPLAAVTYGVEPGDLPTYVAIAVTLGLTGMLATLLPARRATRVDPNSALRND